MIHLLRDPRNLSLAWLTFLLALLLLLGVPAHASSDAATLIRAVNLFEAGHERAGIHALRDYLEKAPKNVEARRTLAGFYASLGLLDAARAELEVVVAMAPGNVFDRKALMALSADGRQWSRALALSSELLATVPDDPDALYVAGRACFNLDRATEAFDYLTRCVRAGKRQADVHNMLGLIALHRKDLKGARADLRLATELDGSHAMYQNNLGYVLELLGELEEAWNAYDRAATLSPEAKSFETNLERVESRLKRRRGTTVVLTSRVQ